MKKLVLILGLIFLTFPIVVALSDTKAPTGVLSLSKTNPATIGSSPPSVDMVLQDFAEFVKNTEFICLARVVKVVSRREQYDPEANLVMSRITLEILENWKGTLKTGVEIRSFGGVLDDIPYFAAEFPRFEEGEEVILFLKNFQGGLFPVGHRAGKMTVIDGTIIETGAGLNEMMEKIEVLSQ